MTDQSDVHPLLRQKPIDLDAVPRPRSQDLSQQNRLIVKAIRCMFEEAGQREEVAMRSQKTLLEVLDRRVVEFAAWQERANQTIGRLTETVRQQQALIKTVHERMFQFAAWQDSTTQAIARDDVARTILEETVERQRLEAGRAEEERETLRAECARVGAELALLMAASATGCAEEPASSSEPRYATGREVRVWYADRKRYFEGRILAHLGENEYRIVWSHQKRPEVVTLAPEHETRDQADDDRFHLL